jgi:hypothetical protein
MTTAKNVRKPENGVFGPNFRPSGAASAQKCPFPAKSFSADSRPDLQRVLVL